MAWAFERYVTDATITHLEAQARGSRRGLWADPEPMAPWEWRHRAARARQP